MIKPEQIPDEAIEAAARAFAAVENGNELIWDAYISYAEYAIAAAINAWPGGMELLGEGDFCYLDHPGTIILFPQEKNDD